MTVFGDGAWGAVCGAGWDLGGAHGACRRAGYAGALQAYTVASSGTACGSSHTAGAVCAPPDGVETGAPRLTEARADGALVTLRFDAPLDGTFVPAPQDFLVLSGGPDAASRGDHPVLTASVADSTVELRAARPWTRSRRSPCATRRRASPREPGRSSPSTRTKPGQRRCRTPTAAVGPFTPSAGSPVAPGLQPEDFRIVTRSGAERSPICSTLGPASDAGELRTVLLIGEFGGAADDPPVKVLVVDDLFWDGVTGGPVNFRGTRTHVAPLDAGPSLVLAEVVPEDGWSRSEEDRGSGCPEGVLQVGRATWSGGVRLPTGGEPGDAERALYRVTVERPDGSSDEIVPAALADLGDRDNHHLLCLDTSAPAVSVSFPAGHLVDPNQDLNPDTHVAVNSASAEAPRP